MTSTLTIVGNVNGRKINVTHEYVMEDVYDAGVHFREGDTQTLMTSNTAGGEEITFSQDTPNYLMCSNASTFGVSRVDINGSSSVVGFYLPPGGLFCLTGRLGLVMATSSSTSITLEDVASVVPTSVPPMPPGRISLFVAFNAST